MSGFDYDLLVIGAGSGGVRAARMAAASGARVAVAEKDALGGTCVNVGCIPKKLFVLASHFREEYREAEGFGWSRVQADFSWSQLRDNKNAEIARLNGIYEELLKTAGAVHLEGHAQLLGPHEVQLAGQAVSAEKILIATGGWPFVPDFPGAEHAITSNEAFFLPDFPKRVVIGGGGYIAVEFAGIFAGLGAETRLVYRGPLFLRGFDDDLRSFTADEMRKKGLQLHFEDDFQRIEKQQDGSLAVHLASGQVLETDLVLLAMGRKPRVRDLGLDKTRVRLSSQGAIEVNEWFQTAEPSIFALGDVTGRVQLTPVAIREAKAFVSTQFLGRPEVLDYEKIPTAVFCQPEIGTVGMTEAEATAAGFKVDVYLAKFRPLRHTLSGSSEQALVKLLVDQASDRVLGVHLAGASAAETIQGMGIAMQAGATKATFDATLAVHPTSAEELVTFSAPSRSS